LRKKRGPDSGRPAFGRARPAGIPAAPASMRTLRLSSIAVRVRRNEKASRGAGGFSSRTTKDGSEAQRVVQQGIDAPTRTDALAGDREGDVELEGQRTVQGIGHTGKQGQKVPV